MRLIHTADWQIGKVFRFVDDATMHNLQEARLAAVTTIGRLATEHDTGIVLVAGDVYDKEGLSDLTLGQPIERMRAWPKIAWHLLPGNHDPHLPNGVWDRLCRLGLPGNVHVHLEPVASPIADGSAYLLPAPLRRRSVLTDPTAWMDQAATPEGAWRVGLAHGSITRFGSSDRPAPNLISPTRAQDAGLAYLALGDWHGTKQISKRCWYAGTPEPDGFDQVDSGHVLLVDLAGPAVQRLRSAKYSWRSERVVVHGRDDVTRLDQHIRAQTETLERLMLDLTVEGTLALADREIFQQCLDGFLRAAVGFLRLDDSRLLVEPSSDDLRAIGVSGVVRMAAERLETLADDPDNPARETAAQALMRLYLETRKLASS